MLIVVLICIVCSLSLLLRKQYSTISDLLDRITAPDFHTYQLAREKEQRKMEVVNTKEFFEQIQEGNDGIRVD
jgi:hypothetical protein